VSLAPPAVAAPPTRRHGGPAVALAGVIALLARPALARLVHDPTSALVVLFVALGLVGLFWPVAAPVRRGPVAGALAVGIAAFAAGRLLGAGTVLTLPAAVVPLLLNTLAAVAEETFFRRLVYGLLEPRGTAIAVAGSAVAFALVHVTVWGFGVLPLDLAAGLLLSWQRAATGRWTVPAATHVAANLLAAL
jgi:Type II CAAX prenyl endopeptidase Rce1-like